MESSQNFESFKNPAGEDLFDFAQSVIYKPSKYADITYTLISNPHDAKASPSGIEKPFVEALFGNRGLRIGTASILRITFDKNVTALEFSYYAKTNTLSEGALKASLSTGQSTVEADIDAQPTSNDLPTNFSINLIGEETKTYLGTSANKNIKLKLTSKSESKKTLFKTIEFITPPHASLHIDNLRWTTP